MILFKTQKACGNASIEYRERFGPVAVDFIVTDSPAPKYIEMT